MKNPELAIIAPVHEALRVNLQELWNGFAGLSNGEYSLALPLLSGSSIGGHVRHCIEMLQCVQEGYAPGLVCYENRKRNPVLENEVEQAGLQLQFLKDTLFLDDRELLLVADYSQEGRQAARYATSYFRELAYCLEHNIHHMALVRIGLYTLGLKPENTGFGVAPSTIRFKGNIK